MQNILLIESATDVCGAAIAQDGQTVVIQQTHNTRDHAALLTCQIQSCCDQSGIPLNTGLRVGASVAKGICYALDLPLIQINTLEAIAWGNKNTVDAETYYAPMLDARRDEIWMALFGPTLNPLLDPKPYIAHVNLFESLFEKIYLKKIHLCGNGISKLYPLLCKSNTYTWGSNCCNVDYLSNISFNKLYNADFIDIKHFEPTYMKPPNVTTSNKPNGLF
jgi:tRNA threonylcarbamoyladenosine biosynthesis protein TsaB